MRFIMNGIFMLVAIGLFIAVMRQFDWDFIAAFEWLFGLFFSIVDRIAEFFSNNKTFNEMTSPGVFLK